MIIKFVLLNLLLAGAAVVAQPAKTDHLPSRFLIIAFDLPRAIQASPRCEPSETAPLFGALTTRFQQRDIEAHLFRLPPNEFIGEGPSYAQLQVINNKINNEIFLLDNFYVEIYGAAGLDCELLAKYTIIGSTCTAIFPLGQDNIVCDATGDPAPPVLLRTRELSIDSLQSVSLSMFNPELPDKAELSERLGVLIR